MSILKKEMFSLMAHLFKIEKLSTATEGSEKCTNKDEVKRIKDSEELWEKTTKLLEESFVQITNKLGQTGRISNMINTENVNQATPKEQKFTITASRDK